MGLAGPSEAKRLFSCHTAWKCAPCQYDVYCSVRIHLPTRFVCMSERTTMFQELQGVGEQQQTEVRGIGNEGWKTARKKIGELQEPYGQKPRSTQ